jgi:uncharacterized protein YbaA (DUF1428 family)
MAKRLIEGPIVFQSPFWDGVITIANMDDYRTWARFARRIDQEHGAEERIVEIWEEEKLMGLNILNQVVQTAFNG